MFNFLGIGSLTKVSSTSFLISLRKSFIERGIPCSFGSNNFSGLLLYFFKTSVCISVTLFFGNLVNLCAIAPMPAKPTENTAPAVAPRVVSTASLLGSSFASSEPCQAAENTNGVANVANAPTLRSDITDAFLLGILAKDIFLPNFNLRLLTTPLPNLPHPIGINNK